MRKSALASVLAAVALVVGSVGFAAPASAQRSGPPVNPAIILGVVAAVAVGVLVVAGGGGDGNNRPVSP